MSIAPSKPPMAGPAMKPMPNIGAQHAEALGAVLGVA
jgi:hypothetical protein